MSSSNTFQERFIPQQPGSIIKVSEQLTCFPPFSLHTDLSCLRSLSLHKPARAFPFNRLAVKLSQLRSSGERECKKGEGITGGKMLRSQVSLSFWLLSVLKWRRARGEVT